ncbi:hypothetical protein BJY24_005560 [Nocardia transvalensis]|uniref:DoxX-like protein n=1 Tax=Nocardia transvalensis TaxID=37333 RepID=A0A7W9PJ41_9NOCA|nr:DoxX family protein [Nocardia transvalensis]MBB5916648.1 hypothetical protein [Nocardia transvalensis]
MFAAYVALTLLTATAAGAGCWLNYARHPIPVAAAKVVRVPQSWIPVLGTLLGAGALGLLAGFAVPALGIAAAICLVLYFIGAVVAHLRVGDYALGPVSVSLALTVATATVTLAYRFG